MSSVRRIPLSQPLGLEAYRQVAETLNEVIRRQQPFDVISLSTDFTVSEDYGVYIVDSSAGTITASMPPAKAYASMQFVIKKIDAGNTINVVPSSGDTIEQSSSGALTSAGDAHRYVSDGISDWVLIGGH